MYAGGADSFFTERNATLARGVFMSKAGIGTVTYNTADDGTTYTPPTSVGIAITGTIENARCAIYASGSGQPNADGLELMNQLADVDGEASTTYTYTGADQNILARARLKGYLPYVGVGTITDAGLTISAV